MPSRTLASAAVRTSPAKAGSEGAPAATPSKTATSAIRLRVNVPVLSTHRTVTAPSASTACGCRVSTCWRARRQAPSASITVQTTANSSGMIDIASVSPTSRPEVHEPSRQANTLAAKRQVSAARKATARTRRESWSCSRLGRGAISASTPPMRPMAVRKPVASTWAMPSPWTTSVPACSVAASAVRTSASLSTGADSPLSSDSSTRSPCASCRRASQARRSPSWTTRRSPTTSSWLAMRRTMPPRTTVLRGLARSRKASSTRCVRSSW
jgi:hypothetical protein